jgi:hypothetical protein
VAHASAASEPTTDTVPGVGGVRVGGVRVTLSTAVAVSARKCGTVHCCPALEMLALPSVALDIWLRLAIHRPALLPFTLPNPFLVTSLVAAQPDSRHIRSSQSSSTGIFYQHGIPHTFQKASVCFRKSRGLPSRSGSDSTCLIRPGSTQQTVTQQGLLLAEFGGRHKGWSSLRINHVCVWMVVWYACRPAHVHARLSCR